MTRQITPGLSAALDALRAFAALYVLVHHVLQARGIFTGPAVLFLFGQEAVLVFFLLSGFVIQASENGRVSGDLRGYWLRRALRIYPVLIAALCLSTLIAFLQNRLATSFSWSSLIGTLLGLQDDGGRKPGAIVLPYLHNDALWSLSYEIWFYALFPLANALQTRLRAPVLQLLIGCIGLVALALYLWMPNFPCLVLAYFPIWWLGAALATCWSSEQPPIRSTAILQASLLGSALLVLVYSRMHGFPVALVHFPWLIMRHFLAALLLFYGLALLVGRQWSSRIDRYAAGLGFAASLSYGVYALHIPIVIDTGLYRSSMGLVIGIAMLFALCWLLDRKLSLWLRGALRLGRSAQPPSVGITLAS